MNGEEFLRSLDPEYGNALDRLTVALRNAVANRFGEYGWDECEEEAGKILRQHAHELAEKLRAHGMDTAADQIDPEVKT